MTQRHRTFLNIWNQCWVMKYRRHTKCLSRKKGSKDFAGFIENYIEQISRDGMRFHDVIYLDRVIFTSQELTDLFQKQTEKLSVEERLGKVRAVFYKKTRNRPG